MLDKNPLRHRRLRRLKELARLSSRAVPVQCSESSLVEGKKVASSDMLRAEVRSLENLRTQDLSPGSLYHYLAGESPELLAAVESTQGNRKTVPKQISFVCPVLPHPCELELWNLAVRRLGVKAVVLTSDSESYGFVKFEQACTEAGIPLYLECVPLETIPENRTFLAGLDSHLSDAGLIVSVGESSLASYQVVKARRNLRNRFAVWQIAPRPPEAFVGARNNGGVPLPEFAREKTVRREVLKHCDAVISFDKDSSTWAYLENVSPQRIRRVGRGVNLARFSQEMSAEQRISLRESLGLPVSDFIFLQAGPLEIETGALDSVYAFKSLLQSNPGFLNNTKLVFCGTGSAGADVRQAVVDLHLDDHVYFLNPNDPSMLQLLGNRLSGLVSICDALIHNPISPVNGLPAKNMDCSYDVLCALASGLTVVSNGNGWIGEWIARFFRIFSCANVHSQAKMMRESIEKQDRLVQLKKSVRKALENEMDLGEAALQLSEVLRDLMCSEVRVDSEDITQLFEVLDETIKARKYLDAIQLISKAFESFALTDGQRATLFRHIGDCFTKLGDLENGLQNYLRAMELDPYCAKTLIGMGTVALQRKDYNVAVPYFQKAISLAPHDDMSSLGLGLAFEGLGEMTQAMLWSSRACQMNIENTAAIFNLVKLSYELESYDDAEKILARYVSLHPHDVNMAFTYGGIAFKLGKMDLAVKTMETILTLDPTNSRAHGLLAQIRRKVDSRRPA